MINVWIDELTPCLKNNQTGEIVETEVIRMKRKSFLSRYNKRNGWYVNWGSLLSENEVYALVVKGSVDICGLIALQPNNDFCAVYISWMCVSPENNKLIADSPKYSGIGGHLFSIAIRRSREFGFDGAVTGNAADMKLVEHYKKAFHAVHIGMLHPYQFVIEEPYVSEIEEVYNYEWTGDEL